MNKSFFDRWFPGETNNWDGLFQEIDKLLPTAGKLLDLGCGDHAQLSRFHTSDREAWGADFQEHPEQKSGDWFRLLAKNGAIPFDADVFDLVSTNMVLEHVAAPATFLAEVARVLKPGGYFVAHTISASHYVTWIRRLIGVMPHAWNQWLVRKLYHRADHDTFPTHYRMNRPGRIARFAEPVGLQLISVRRYASQGYFAFSPLLFRCAVLTDWLLEKLVAGMGRLYFTAVFQKTAAIQTGQRTLPFPSSMDPPPLANAG